MADKQKVSIRELLSYSKILYAALFPPVLN